MTWTASARSLTAALAAGALAGWAATAPAQATAPTPTAPAPTAPAPTVPPVKASVRLRLPDAFFVGGHPVTVPRRVIHVTGVVTPWVPGQVVKVQVLLGARRIKVALLRLRPSADRRHGTFREAFSSPGVGHLTVVAGHTRDEQMLAFRAQRGLAVLSERIGWGATGRFVELIQQRLAALHFYVPRTGVYDTGTGLAVDAYHRLLHRGTAQTLDGLTISYLLDGFGAFRVRFPGHGRHAEGDLSRQLLALVDGARVRYLFPISSGKPSTPTVLGDYRIYSRVPGYLPDGMYYSDFFLRGYAIHGYDPAPDYPASHGCMRLPIPDAVTVYDWLALGDWVDVYY